MNKLVVLNGPPRSGKDTIADWFEEHTYSTSVSFKYKLMKIALEVSGVNGKAWYDRYTAEHSKGFSGEPVWWKDIPWDRLGGKSEREYLIWLSEDVVKPVHGERYFGEELKRYIKVDDDAIYFASDGGFVEELMPFIEDDDFDVYIIRLSREGCTFDGDSRNYLPDNLAKTLDVENNGTILEVAAKIDKFINEEDV